MNEKDKKKCDIRKENRIDVNDKREEIEIVDRFKKLDWITEFLEFALEDRELDEQRELLLRFKKESERLLEKI